jgi:hypothetical protein
MESPLPRQRSGPIVLKVSSSDFNHRAHHPALDTLLRWQGPTRFIDDGRVDIAPMSGQKTDSLQAVGAFAS